METSLIELQILICTFGRDGLQRVASLPHPRVEGVEYVVSWQQADLSAVPSALSERPDFKIFPTATTGLSANRNEALRHATAPFALISDDDLGYEEEDLRLLLSMFRKMPGYSVLAFQYRSKNFPRSYPVAGFDLSHPPRGYYAVSFEIGLNLRRIRRIAGRAPELCFNENFGVGARFGNGEEEILLHDLLKAGHRGAFVPREIVTHDGSTTSDRIRRSPRFIATRGAVHLHLHPLSWPLRMAVHALRESRSTGLSVAAYCKAWISGVAEARKAKVFKDYKHPMLPEI